MQITEITQVSIDLCKAAGVTLSAIPSVAASAAASGSAAASSGAAKTSGSSMASMTPSGSGTPAQSTGGASAMLANVGAVALGVAGIFAF
jgi:hypothetical protein